MGFRGGRRSRRRRGRRRGAGGCGGRRGATGERHKGNGNEAGEDDFFHNDNGCLVNYLTTQDCIIAWTKAMGCNPTLRQFFPPALFNCVDLVLISRRGFAEKNESVSSSGWHMSHP